MIDSKKLEKYLDLGFNVLLEGTHGLAKTAVVKNVFEKKGLKWKYFSASTMDPWIDFIGVPKTTVGKDGVEELVLVKPREFAHDEVEAIFFDEFNRAPDKVLNAVMELIQFRSINGKKFNNLKVIWAAINPYDEDGTYSVAKIDAATRDRFHIQIKVPLELDKSYLHSIYGDYYIPFAKWWDELPSDLKLQISPRRLDYVIHAQKNNCDLRDLLPSESNIKKLESLIASNNKKVSLSSLLKKTEEEKQAFFTLENSLNCFDEIVNSKNLHSLMKYIPKDWIESVLQDQNHKKRGALIQYSANNENFVETLSKSSQEIIQKVKKTKGYIPNNATSISMGIEIDKLAKSLLSKKTINALIKSMNPVFQEHCKLIAKQKSTDIVGFFETFLESAQNHYPNAMKHLIDILTPKSIAYYRSMNAEHQTLVGLLMNFTLKKAKDEKLSEEAGFKNYIMQQIFTSYKPSVHKKKEFIYTLWAFNEEGWEELKKYLIKNVTLEKIGGSILIRKHMDNTIVARAGLNSKNQYREPTSIQNAKNIFSMVKI